MIVNYEITDTFGGEANYSWCRRGTFTVDDKTKDRTIVRMVKKDLGITGVRCKKNDFGDMIELRPYGSCTVCFITFDGE